MKQVVRWRWRAELVPCRNEESRVVVVGGCRSMRVYLPRTRVSGEKGDGRWGWRKREYLLGELGEYREWRRCVFGGVAGGGDGGGVSGGGGGCSGRTGGGVRWA